jgi:hypothetical protein
MEDGIEQHMSFLKSEIMNRDEDSQEKEKSTFSFLIKECRKYVDLFTCIHKK